MSEPILVTRGLAARYGRRRVLDGVDLELEAGTVTALVGCNGAGKTTLLSVLAGVLPRDGGEVRVLGLDPRRRGTELRAAVGWMPDRLAFPRWMRVEDSLRLAEPFYPTWSRSEERRLLELLGLDRRARLSALSKGERNKHALLLALAHEPRLLLLDEPFAGLDPAARREVLGALLQSLREAGRTVLLSSHSLADLERAADRLALLQDGRIRRQGELERLRASFARVAVTLRDPAAVWTAPGRPRIERGGAELTLVYDDWRAEYEELLGRDPAVAGHRLLARDFEELFLSLAGERSRPCAA